MKRELIAFNEPRSPITENFKALRTNLQFMNANDNIQTILITSTLPGEGKSWTAANLAITFAQAGNKVVIVDADMRKGRQFSLFDVLPRPGLSNYLSRVVNSKTPIDVEELENFIRETEIENLYVIPAGDVPPNPSELLVTQRTVDLIEKLKSIFEVIIIDTPPATLVTDSKILSRLANVSLIVATHKGTKMDNLKKVKKEIENVGGKVGGVILNKVPTTTKKYEGGYYYGETSLAFKEKKGQDMFIRSKSTLLEDRKEQKNINQILNSDAKKKTANTERKTEKVKEKDGVKYILENNKITIDKTQDILNQINSYLAEEKRKMNKGK